MFRVTVSALATLWFFGFALPAAAGAERVVEALFACDTDFFEVLKSERSAFRSQEVRTVLYEHLRTDIVEFDPPVEVLGLRLTSYRQDTVLNYGLRPSAFSWGFQVDETPVGTALALWKYFPGEKPFRGTVDMLQATKGYPDQPGKLFAISKPRLAGETGANLECHSGRKDLGNIWSLPDVVDLFSETWASGSRWQAWIFGWLD
ncbi:hypothetical protein [Ensifer sp. LC163]|uniref:hypothetical protein n=1 Tax=Ensifer sp. LC163 TaxID=1120652 RepID=UPI0008137327|nr:hypothetical protein [Ensifer sp. LC163]OCP38622.1 hypothetical protein BC360_00680 [Ensifer sp. LC163]